MMKYTILLVALLASGCLDSRERLDPPRLYLRVDETSVAPGGEIFGTVSAADAHGIIYIAAQLEIQDDSLNRPQRAVRNDIQQDTIDFAFSFTVPSGLPSGRRLVVTATAIDDQGFEVSRSDTSFIR
jgi:hypothetical protein